MEVGYQLKMAATYGVTPSKFRHTHNPAFEALVDESKLQDDEVGDGTTSVVVLAGELIKAAIKLDAEGIHLITIIEGIRFAAECALSTLLANVKDNKDDPDKFKTDLMKIATSTLSSKIPSHAKEHIAKLAVDTVMRLKPSTNLESVQITKKLGGSLAKSHLQEGFDSSEMGQPSTIVLQDESSDVLDVTERSLQYALYVLSQTVNDGRVVLGGGWPEMIMSNAVEELARKTSGKASRAIAAFSEALLVIPTIIADNADLNSGQLIAELRAEHEKINCKSGIDVFGRAVGNMSELGVLESFKVKEAVLLSAAVTVESILEARLYIRGTWDSNYAFYLLHRVWFKVWRRAFNFKEGDWITRSTFKYFALPRDKLAEDPSPSL
jgi:chaperonin GroEL (HSP60 family)